MSQFVELLVVEYTEVGEEVDEGGEDCHDRHHVTCPIGEVVVRLDDHGGVLAVDVETTEVMVLECRTASIRAKNVSEVPLIVIPRESTAG